MKNRMTEKVRASDGSLTVSEMQRREEASQAMQPMTTYCAIAGCMWSFEGTVAQCRDASAAHRMRPHVQPDAARAVSGNGHVEGLDLLERMDAGERVVAATLREEAAVGQSADSGSADVPGEPERAATSPSLGPSVRLTYGLIADGLKSVGELATARAVTPNLIGMHAHTLMQKGLVRRVGRGLYEATSSEREPQAAPPPAEQPTSSQSPAGPPAAVSAPAPAPEPSRSEGAAKQTGQGGAAAAVAALVEAARAFADTLERSYAQEAGSR